MLTRLLPIALAATLSTPAAAQDAALEARVARVLATTPLIDGHNDLPYQLRGKRAGSVEGMASGSEPLMTDMARLRAGRVGGQMWSVYIPAGVTGDAAVRETLEQIDLVDRLVAAYPQDLAWAHGADEVASAFAAGRIASMAGIEGGHQIGDGNLAALRQFRRLGAVYMTLTHNRTTGWADSATDRPVHGGLSDFGRSVVAEMNRIGMLVDLSHVSEAAMHDALDASAAPVIFSHSAARAIGHHPRNVPDSVLERLPANGGVVMVPFVPAFINDAAWQASARYDVYEAGLEAMNPGDPEGVAAAMRAWNAATPRPVTTIAMVADHLDHIARIAGHDHVGIGGDLDGTLYTVQGLDSVDDYPALFIELARRGWSDDQLARLAGGNVLRVMRQAEAVAAAMADRPPSLEKSETND